MRVLISWLRHYIIFPQSIPPLTDSIITASSLLLLMHRNRLQPSRGMDNPGCCCSFCQTKIEAGIRAKNNLVFVFDDWPFQRRSILAASQQRSLYLIHCVNIPLSTKIVCACLLLSAISNRQVMGLLLTASGLCASHQDESIC